MVLKLFPSIKSFIKIDNFLCGGEWIGKLLSKEYMKATSLNCPIILILFYRNTLNFAIENNK